MMKKFLYLLFLYFLIPSCSYENRYRKKVDLDTVKIVPSNQKYVRLKELNLYGLSISEIEKLYGKKKYLYWERRTYEGPQYFGEGVFDTFPMIKEYPVDIIAFVWERSREDSISMCVFFAIENGDTVVIDAEQVPDWVLTLD